MAEESKKRTRTPDPLRAAVKKIGEAKALLEGAGRPDEASVLGTVLSTLAPETKIYTPSEAKALSAEEKLQIIRDGRYKGRVSDFAAA